MADPSTYRPAPGTIPTSPGVYRFLDAQRRVIYVGKAKNLRARLANYFQDLAGLPARTQQMVTTAAAVEWTVVATEVEALTLEYAWIKEFDPRFNVMYKDDKSYPYLAVTLEEDYPRVQVMRGARRSGVRYFGPYTHAWAIRQTVDTLLRIFPMRSCSAGVFRRASAAGRPCLLGYLDKCAAPCVGRISQSAHRQLAEDLCDFMAGRTGRVIAELRSQMQAAAAALDYEQAARLRDNLAAIDRVLEANAVVLPDATDADVFALARDELEAAVQVFHVRGGRIRGQRGWVVELVEELEDAELIAKLLTQVYGAAADYAAAASPTPTDQDMSATGRARRGRAGKQGAASVDDVDHSAAGAIPREVLVPCLPTDHEQVTAWLRQLRGGQVAVRVPQRGDKKELAARVHANAEQALTLHRAKRAGDLTVRAQALSDLADFLDLTQAPLRIECFDVSHTQGTHQVASMVVFEDGVPKKSAYRSFVIRGQDGAGARDDTAAMGEVLRRRLRRLQAEERGETGEDDDGVALVSGPLDPNTGQPRRFAYRPDLLVVDGGLPQVNAAQRVLDELGISDLQVVGLAKRLEEVWVPGEDFPLVLPRTSPALHLLQAVRDESHRFAIQAHRKKRSRAMTRSRLDEISGLGPARQAALLKKFGSLAGIRAASAQELAQVPGIGPALAATIRAALQEAVEGPRN
ncbi:excinuclease ABC subunit UvrC [Buchananella hordeovulneris]|uniref:UvrABC system protein C n=1 Tax=Buchananella hordeovulneris TaxID=52770 RepID=A0A1Q5PXL5_9ACTO|nr:excinuclease ABC subunit UvrC [Buchananella hordeovulneris]OKL52351.1 excinuclease ABC subunit C [Buchananella hordeovulneris]